MPKLATPQDLQTKLRRLLTYANTEAPSRARIATALNELADQVMMPGRRKMAGAFDSENKTQLSALKTHLKSALEDVTKANALVIALEKAAKGNKGLERRFDKWRSEVSEAAANLGSIHNRLERELDED